MSDFCPPHWSIRTLEEIADINPSRKSSDADPSSLFHFVPMKAVAEEFGGVSLDTMRPLSEVAKGFTQFCAGDVIIAKITPCMENGKIAIIPALKSPWAYGSTEFHVLRPHDGIENRWIAHYLSQSSIRRDARAKMSGSAGQLRVPTSWLDACPIPVAPTPEQRRIVAKIEELFSDLDAGVAALGRVRANLKRYRAAVLKAAVEGSIGRNGSPHAPPPWKPIGEVIHDLEQGWSPKCESVPATDADEWAVMTTTAIQPLRFSSDENKRLPKSLAPRADLEVRVGDMVITRAGPRTRAGVACLVRSTRKRLILCDKAYRFQCDEKQVRGAFLEIALNADPVLRNLEKMKTGISDSGVNLTQPRFRELLVPVPSLSDQDRIVAEVDRRLSVADAAEAQVEHALQRAARLRQSILKRAFEGRLVDQDPSDEPAAALLQRIKAGSNGHGGGGAAVIRNKDAGADKPAKRRSRAHA